MLGTAHGDRFEIFRAHYRAHATASRDSFFCARPRARCENQRELYQIFSGRSDASSHQTGVVQFRANRVARFVRCHSAQMFCVAQFDAVGCDVQIAGRVRLAANYNAIISGKFQFGPEKISCDGFAPQARLRRTRAHRKTPRNRRARRVERSIHKDEGIFGTERVGACINPIIDITRGETTAAEICGGVGAVQFFCMDFAGVEMNEKELACVAVHYAENSASIRVHALTISCAALTFFITITMLPLSLSCPVIKP